jgi:hypothetical protein
MSISMCIAFEKSERAEGLLKRAGSAGEYGQSIPRYLEAISLICRELGLKDLQSFVCQEPDVYEEALEVAEQYGYEEYAESFKDAIEEVKRKQKWFKATEGLATVRGVLHHLEEKSKHGAKDPGMDGVLSDLRAFERALEAASTGGVLFHFWVS